MSTHQNEAANDEPTVNIIKEVTINGETRYLLDVEKIGEILNQPEFGHLPIAIYSIAGPFRTGKSFLLNLIIRHYNQRHPDGDQATDEQATGEQATGEQATGEQATGEQATEEQEEEKMMKIFSWKGGVSKHTKGILMLKRPLTLYLGGQEVALYLMDTQGMLDTEASSGNMGVIGTSSFLLASQQIFNTSSKIESHHLSYIYKFANLSNKIQKKNRNIDSPLQSLMLLVRDWKFKVDNDYGFGGGKDYLNETLENESADEEHQLTREYLENAFGEIPCFLLPPPGNDIEEMGKNQEDCNISDMKEIFMHQATELIKYSFRNLVLKKNRGRTITGPEFMHYIPLYASCIEEGLEGNVKSLIMADFYGSMNKLTTSCILEYVKNVWAGLPVKDRISMELKDLKNKIEELDTRNVIIAKKKFKDDEKLGSEDFWKKWEPELDRMLGECFKWLQICIEAEKEFTSVVKELTKFMQSQITIPLEVMKRGKEKFNKLVEKIKRKEEHVEVPQQERQEETPDEWLKLSEDTELKIKKEIDRLAGVLKKKLEPQIADECCDNFKYMAEVILSGIRKKKKGKAVVVGVGLLGLLISTGVAAAIAFPVVASIAAWAALDITLASVGSAAGGIITGSAASYFASNKLSNPDVPLPSHSRGMSSLEEPWEINCSVKLKVPLYFGPVTFTAGK